MDRESWGVDPEFYELAGTDVALDNVGRNVEVVWVLVVHGNTVHQLIFVGELLVAELLLQVVHLICIENSQPDCRFVRRCPFNSVFFVGRNVHKIAELKFSQYCSRIEASLHPAEQCPRLLILVVPETLRRNMAVGDYPFNSDVGSIEQRCEKVVREVGGKIIE